MSECVRRLVLIPVGQFDLRATVALEQSLRLPADTRRAIHVTTDEDGMHALATAWMASALEFPLDIIDNSGGLARSIGDVVEKELANGFDEVVVVLGKLELRRRLHRLLHDRSADAIASVVSKIPRARAQLVSAATT
jgi:hypothetical protein